MAFSDRSWPTTLMPPDVEAVAEHVFTDLAARLPASDRQAPGPPG
jgi:hypothetical protein